MAKASPGAQSDLMLSMEVVQVVNNFNLIWMARFMHLGKETMFSKVAFKGLFRDEIGVFRQRALDGINLEHRPGKKISVVCSIVHQNPDGVLLSPFSLHCNNNTAICMTGGLFCSLRAVEGYRYLVFSKSCLFEFVYGMICP